MPDDLITTDELRAMFGDGMPMDVSSLRPARCVEAPAEPKCCRKCAFRPGSPERSDPYAWMHLREGWDDGLSFACHESVPGHPQEVADDRSRMRICAGWQACSSTRRFPRATPGPEFMAELTERSLSEVG